MLSQRRKVRQVGEASAIISNKCQGSKKDFFSGRLCENSFGALRRRSGRTAKCLISNEAIPFVVSPVEP